MTMPHPRSYQPELHPHLIKGLHHEAKLRGVPMTVLLRSIVTQALEPRKVKKLSRAKYTWISARTPSSEPQSPPKSSLLIPNVQLFEI